MSANPTTMKVERMDPFIRLCIRLGVTPNMLTLARLCAVPFVIYFYIPRELSLVSFFIFVGGWILDLYDGWLARVLELVTQFGQFFDPVADKIFFLTPLTMFFIMNLVLPVTYYSFVLVELSLVAVRLLKVANQVVHQTEKADLGATNWGKHKSYVEQGCIALLLLNSDTYWWVAMVNGILIVALLLAFASLISQLKRKYG